MLRTRWSSFVLVSGTALLAVLLTGAVVAANAWKRDLPLSRIRCWGNRILTDSALVRLAGVPSGMRLYDVDLAHVRARVASNVYVRDVVVTREHPGTLQIDISERVAIASLAAEGMLYVDADGMVLYAVRSEYLFDLPVLTGALPPEQCRPGVRLTAPGAREALILLAAARGVGDEFSRKISEVHLTAAGELVAYTSEGGVPVAFGRGDPVEKVVKLDAFWRDVVQHRGVQGLESVDLRYADQVIARWAETGQRNQE